MHFFNRMNLLFLTFIAFSGCTFHSLSDESNLQIAHQIGPKKTAQLIVQKIIPVSGLILNYATLFVLGEYDEPLSFQQALQCRFKDISHFPPAFNTRQRCIQTISNLRNVLNFPAFSAEELRLLSTDETPGLTIFQAAFQQNVLAIHYFIASDINPNNLNTDGMSALHISVFNNAINIVITLLTSRHININLRTNDDDDSLSTPLHIATTLNFTDIVRVLVSDPRINVNSEASNRFTPLHIAVCNDSPEIVQMLLQSPLINPNQVAAHRKSVLHLCTSGRIAKLVLSHPQINPNSQDKRGQTPLHVSARTGQTRDVFQELLGHVNINLNIQDMKGRTVLMVAMEEENDEAVLMVLGFSDRLDINLQDKFGRTAVHYAVMFGNASILENILSINRIDLNIMDRLGQTAFDVANNLNPELAGLFFSHLPI